MLGYVYGHTTSTTPPWKAGCVSLTDGQPTDRIPPRSQLSPNQDFGIKVAAPIGNLFGQLLFGWLADILGRKRMCTSWFIFCALHGSNLATPQTG
jgi:MFS family permease